MELIPRRVSGLVQDVSRRKYIVCREALWAKNHPQENAPVMEQAVTALPQMVDLEALRDRILLDLKLGC